MKTKDKIVIFGGSFDPCHLGHIKLVSDVIDEVGAKKIILVPTFVQPFKTDKKAISPKHRIKILELATKKFKNLEISDIEINRKGISYTIDTLRSFKAQYEPCQICFLCGADSLLSIDRWTSSEEILSDYTIIVGKRPRYMDEVFDEKVEILRKQFKADIIIIENEMVDVSSTDIRRFLMQKKSISNLVGEEVERYIIENGLYM